MKSKLYRYSVREPDLILGYPMLTIGLSFLASGLLVLIIYGDPASFLMEFLFGVAFAFFGYGALNRRPDIKVDEKGLWVQTFTFGFRWKFVPWSNLVSMTERRYPRIFGKRLECMIVRARGLPVVYHPSVGFYSSWKFTPGFIIFPSISEFDELVATIRQKLEERA